MIKTSVGREISIQACRSRQSLSCKVENLTGVNEDCIILSSRDWRGRVPSFFAAPFFLPFHPMKCSD